MKIALLLALVSSFCFVRPVTAETTAAAGSYTGTDIYPSAIIATATVDWHANDEEGDPDEAADKPLGDPQGWVGARLLEVPKGAKIKVEVMGEGWLKPSKV